MNLMKIIRVLAQKLGEYENTIQGIIVALVTVGIDEIIEIAAFKCPCVAESDLAIPCTAALNSCPRRDKELYAYLFILVPSFILLMAGLSFNQIVWKETTSCCRNYNPGCKAKCTSFSKIFGFALISPSVWLVVSFLDGDYFACAQTDLPYKMKVNETCQNVSNFYFLANNIVMRAGQKLTKKQFYFFVENNVDRKLSEILN